MLRKTLALLTCSAALIGCADLVVTKIDDRPFITTGRMMSATVKNEGTATAGSSTTRLEVRLPGGEFGSPVTAATPSLGSGREVDLDLWSFNLSVLVPPGQCIEVKVCADANSQVVERWREGNNCRVRQLCRPS